MIFPLKFVALLVLVENVSANCKNPLPTLLPKALSCIMPFMVLFDRRPIAENHYSGKMCITMWVEAHPYEFITAKYACELNFGFLTAPQSDAEATYMTEYARSRLHEESNYFGNFTLIVDGKRKKECMTPDTFDKPPCSTDGAFELTDPSANSTYIFSKWAPNQPSNSVIDGKVKECLGMDQDGLLRDMFCEGKESPILVDNQPEYTVNGVYCGFWPIQE